MTDLRRSKDLSREEVIEIRILLRSKDRYVRNQQRIANEYNVRTNTISGIKTGALFLDISYIPPRENI
jgi:hypothetical protein